MSPEFSLRDIHLPPPIDPWPVAPGWWLTFGLLVLLIAGGVVILRKRRRRWAQRRALAQLERLRQRPDVHLAAELSRLLRQVAVWRFPTEHKGLTGEAWLAFLDRPFTDRPFREGVGRCLVEAPYRNDVEIDREALLLLCERWLKALPPGPPRQGRGV